MSLNYNEIGKNIREVRKENGLSQAMLSELVEKSPSYISYIETGAKSMSLDTFVNTVTGDACPPSGSAGHPSSVPKRPRRSGWRGHRFWWWWPNPHGLNCPPPLSAERHWRSATWRLCGANCAGEWVAGQCVE